MRSATMETIADDDEDESVSDYQDAILVKRSCCFRLPCLRKWDRIGTSRDEAKWCARGMWNWNLLMKVREWSEIAAGPKWKTFLRRIRKNRFRSGGRKFRYDELSYSLNFDESAIENQRSSCCDEELIKRNFSMRYASMNSVSGKMLTNVGSGESSTSVC